MTVNLETLLINENRKLATPKELLIVKEYETHSELLQNDALSRVGLNSNLKAGMSIKETISRKQQQTSRFKQERVFHISQIQAICEKYYLRFLETSYYKGTIDKDLPTKITNFEAAYNLKCTAHNTKICAPVESFQLQQKPKDPLLFYAINNEYYYLIHKWGKDLSLIRRLKQLCTNLYLTTITIAFIFTLPLILIPKAGLFIYAVVSTITCIAISMSNEMSVNEREKLRFLKRNEWDSSYID